MTGFLTNVARLARNRLVDSPTSFGARKRAERWAMVDRLFPELASMHIVDLGGTVEAWRRAPLRPASVTVVNLFEPGDSDEDWLHPITGDACSARAILETAGAAVIYDLVFSNSLIEHVGGHAQRKALAEQVLALAPRHWVQTPYRYFPIEPHWLFPGLQFLPMGARSKVAASWPLAHSHPVGPTEAMSEVQWTELIGIAEMRAYFPGSDVIRENVVGLTKSIVAVTTG